MTEPVDRELFDEAIKAGTCSVAMANRYLDIIIELNQVMNLVCKLMDTGRHSDARKLLGEAHDKVAEKLL